MTDCCNCKNYEPMFDITKINDIDLWEIYIKAYNNVEAGKELEQRTGLSMNNRSALSIAIERLNLSLKHFNYKKGKFEGEEKIKNLRDF